MFKEIMCEVYLKAFSIVMSINSCISIRWPIG